jgi:hypothetical protein
MYTCKTTAPPGCVLRSQVFPVEQKQTCAEHGTLSSSGTADQRTDAAHAGHGTLVALAADQRVEVGLCRTRHIGLLWHTACASRWVQDNRASSVPSKTRSKAMTAGWGCQEVQLGRKRQVSGHRRRARRRRRSGGTSAQMGMGERQHSGVTLPP